MTLATAESFRKVKLQVANGVHHVKDEALSRKANKEQEAFTAMRQLNTGDIFEVAANSREAKDADPGTPDKPNPYYTGKFRRVYDEEIGQQPNETPIQAAERLERLAAQIRRDLDTSNAKPLPTQQEVDAARELLSRVGLASAPHTTSLPNALPTDSPVHQAAESGLAQATKPPKKVPDFDKMSDKELTDYAAEEEIDIKEGTKRADMIRILKQSTSRK